MPNNDLDELIRAVTQREAATNSEALTDSLVRATKPAGGEVQVVKPAKEHSDELALIPSFERSREANGLADQLDGLRRSLVNQSVVISENTQALVSSAGKPSAGSSGSTTAEQVVKTVTSTLSISPLITGIAKLFGAFRTQEPPPPLASFTLPPALRVEAGLDAGTQTLNPVSYGQGNQVRMIQAPAPLMAPIQVNINALDSQSFLDHSEDIARAVKEAMLHSHSLNDVVAEL